jgi:hypothetical protein
VEKNGQTVLNKPWPCTEQLRMVAKPTDSLKFIKVSYYKRSILPGVGHEWLKHVAETLCL